MQTKQRVGGSIKDRVVAQELIDERAKCDFDQQELQELLHGGKEMLAEHKQTFDEFGSMKEVANHAKFYEYTPAEMQKDLWKRIKHVYQDDKLFDRYFASFDPLRYPYNMWTHYF
jgi:Ser-tRNA(Ala) deacylase AlaX